MNLSSRVSAWILYLGHTTLSYYCLSGTCVLVVVQYTGVYLVHRLYLSYSTISLHYCYFIVLGILYHSCVCRGSVIIEFVCKKMQNVSCEYDRWVVKTQLCCVIRQTRSLACLCYVPIEIRRTWYGVCELHSIRYGC